MKIFLLLIIYLAILGVLIVAALAKDPFLLIIDLILFGLSFIIILTPMENNFKIMDRKSDWTKRDN